MEGRTKMLAGILGALLLLVAWIYLKPAGDDPGSLGVTAPPASRGSIDEDGGAAPPAARLPRGGGDAKPPVENVEELHLAELQRTPEEYHAGRDPWSFPAPPPPPPAPTPKPPTAAELARQRLLQEQLDAQRRAAEAAAAAEAAKPKPPPFTLKYLGRFGTAAHPIAAFSDGKTVYDVQQGEVIGGKFIVAQIGYESVEIRFVGFPDVPPQRLPVGR
jgi:hypothetical protein